ncbi:P-loop containing nucleoside triphosphate hydrolase protein [Mycena capillaripes]|nr:P-loop containing nucleoside triphosphate hydrolase protein [Mycena capillaripes]
MAVVDTNFKVHEIHAAIVSAGISSSGRCLQSDLVFLDFPVKQTTQSVNNCPPPSTIFHGRQTILDKMHQFFIPDLRKQQIYVLHGLGGTGKTQIALKFVQETSHFTNKIFLDASTTETIETGLKNIAIMKNTGNSIQEAQQWLTINQEEWLLFFDNADDPKLNMNGFLPRCSHGNIIIPSRNVELRGYGGSYSLVTDMDEDEAVVVLLQSARYNVSPANKGMAAEIVKVSSLQIPLRELGYLPLAIIQAGAFILKSGALDSYLDLYTKNRAQLLSEKPVQSHDNHAWTVYTTWQMSFDKLSPTAAMFLQLCSFLHRDGISEDIFSRAIDYEFQTAGPSMEELKGPLDFLSQFLGSTGEWDSLRFLQVTNEIRAYSLINFDPERKVFAVHPLVHSWCQNMANDPELYHSIMVAVIGMSTTGIPDQDRGPTSLKLISHVDSLMHKNPQVAAEFGMEYGRLYYYSYQYKQAEELYVIVLEKRRKLLGEDHIDTLDAMYNLAVTFSKSGQLQKAEELKVIVLEKWRMILGDDHPNTLDAMYSLAITFSKSSQLQKAEELEVIVLEKQRKLLGEDDPATLSVMHNLVVTFFESGQLQRAEELQFIVLEKQRKLLGEDHPGTLDAMHHLGMIYTKLGQHHQAAEIKIQVVEKRKQVLGKNHADTLHAMADMAVTFAKSGQLQKAKELQVIVLEKWRKLLGEDHLNTLDAIYNLAITFSNSGQFQKAEELQVIVLEKQRKFMGDEHPNTLNAIIWQPYFPSQVNFRRQKSLKPLC